MKESLHNSVPRILIDNIFQVYRVDLDTVDGFGASFITYGATLVSVRSGDKDGNVEEVYLQCYRHGAIGKQPSSSRHIT